MADFEVKLDTKGVDRLLSAMADKAKWARVLKSLVATIGFADVIKHFKEKTGPRGSWKPRSKGTQSAYSEIEGGRRQPPAGTQAGWFSPNNELLVLSGRLRQSFSPTNIRMTSNSAALFNPTEYAGKHDRGEGGMPQRQFMWLSESAMDRIEDAFVSTLLKEGA